MLNRILFTSLLSIVFAFGYSQKMNVEKLDSLFQILEAKDKFMGSIPLSHKGKIIYSRSIGQADFETNITASAAAKYRIGSVSKMFTLILKAIEGKKMSLKQTLATYYPTIENATKITIKNLLNHRSGIHNFTNDPDYVQYNTKPQSESQMIAIMEKNKSAFEPNSKADYSNSNDVLLINIPQKIYKKPYAVLINDKITKPLGLKNSYVGGKINLQKNEANSCKVLWQWIKETETDMSIPMGAGAIVSKPTDLTHFIAKLFALKIINESSLKLMTAIQDKFGMGIYQILFDNKKGFGHEGAIDGFSSMLFYFPGDKLAVALTSNGKNYDNDDIIMATLSSFCNKPFAIPTFKKTELKTEDLDPYFGIYGNASFPLKITVTKVKTLIAQATGKSPIALDPTVKDTFEFATSGLIIQFNPKEKQLILKQGGGQTIL